ncbi:MAG: ABC transporter ATP-binding protein [Rhodospirillales bacterium]|nr:ABC transporter ATP-binding protein [Rhodospirillales bacterium]MBO6787188.1 ABC transporter ATP-binding protein [Rhodospirillales bacterium]
MAEMIALSRLTKRFGPLTAVDGIDMKVSRGEVLGFLGPNGAGKSTTMKMVTGFLAPTGGSALVDGIDVTVDPVKAKQRIGYLPEGAPCYGDMTPRGFLNFIADVRALSGKERDKAIDETIERVEIAGVLDQPIETLSKGFKRRVGLAQAILHNPPVLILDEPTDGLDPNQKHQVRTLIQEMAADKAVVISTHILEEVEAVCTRAVVIARGKILADGTPEDLLKRSPLHNAVHVRVAAAAAAAVEGDLKALSVVGAVIREQAGNGYCEFSVTSKSGAPIAPDVAALLKDKGHPVSDLKTEKGALDAVFREITRGPDKKPAEAPHA